MGSRVWNIKGKLRNAPSLHTNFIYPPSHLDTGVAGRHGLHVEWSPHHGLVGPEGGLGGPGPVALPGVGPGAEQVLRVVLQVGEHRLLLGRLSQLLLVGVGLLPELDLVLGDLPVPGVLRGRIVNYLHHVRGLEPPGDVFRGVSGNSWKGKSDLKVEFSVVISYKLTSIN